MNLYLAQLMVSSRPVEVYPLLSVSFERAIRRMLFSRDTIDRITKWAGQAFSAAASDDSWPFIGVTRYGVDEDTLKQHIKANIDGDYLISEMLDFTGMDEFFFKVNTLELYQTNYCTVITDFTLVSTKTESVQVDDSTVEVRAKVIEFHKGRLLNFQNGDSMYLRD